MFVLVCIATNPFRLLCIVMYWLSNTTQYKMSVFAEPLLGLGMYCVLVCNGMYRVYSHVLGMYWYFIVLVCIACIVCIRVYCLDWLYRLYCSYCLDLYVLSVLLGVYVLFVLVCICSDWYVLLGVYVLCVSFGLVSIVWIICIVGIEYISLYCWCIACIDRDWYVLFVLQWIKKHVIKWTRCSIQNQYKSIQTNPSRMVAMPTWQQYVLATGQYNHLYWNTFQSSHGVLAQIGMGFRVQICIRWYF